VSVSAAMPAEKFTGMAVPFFRKHGSYVTVDVRSTRVRLEKASEFPVAGKATDSYARTTSRPSIAIRPTLIVPCDVARII